MKYLIPIILIALLTTFESCVKEPVMKGGYNYYEIDEKLQPMLFDEGSYWIYRNTETNITDSIIVKSIQVDKVGPVNEGNNYVAEYQIFFVEYNSSLTGEYEEEYVNFVISQGSLSGGYVYLASREVGDELQNARIQNIHDTLTIGGQVFHNVVEMNISTDSYVHNNMNLYYADSVGLIKKEIKFNNKISETWNLEDFAVRLRNP